MDARAQPRRAPASRSTRPSPPTAAAHRARLRPPSRRAQPRGDPPGPPARRRARREHGDRLADGQPRRRQPSGCGRARPHGHRVAPPRRRAQRLCGTRYAGADDAAAHPHRADDRSRPPTSRAGSTAPTAAAARLRPADHVRGAHGHGPAYGPRRGCPGRGGLAARTRRRRDGTQRRRGRTAAASSSPRGARRGVRRSRDAGDRRVRARRPDRPWRRGTVVVAWRPRPAAATPCRSHPGRRAAPSAPPSRSSLGRGRLRAGLVARRHASSCSGGRRPGGRAATRARRRRAAAAPRGRRRARSDRAPR